MWDKRCANAVRAKSGLGFSPNDTLDRGEYQVIEDEAALKLD